MEEIEKLLDEYMSAQRDHDDYETGHHYCTSQRCVVFENGETALPKREALLEAIRNMSGVTNV